MADNVAVTAGSGTTVAADEVVDGTLGTAKVQYVKLMDGTLDGTTKGVIGTNGLKADLGGLIEGEDQTNHVLKVEQRFSGQSYAGDILVKTGAGFLHSLTFSCNDSAPTAGNLDVYDNTSASGTKLFSVAFTTTYFLPCTVVLDITFATGLYLDFTTSADVNVVPSWR